MVYSTATQQDTKHTKSMVHRTLSLVVLFALSVTAHDDVKDNAQRRTLATVAADSTADQHYDESIFYDGSPLIGTETVQRQRLLSSSGIVNKGATAQHQHLQSERFRALIEEAEARVRELNEDPSLRLETEATEKQHRLLEKKEEEANNNKKMHAWKQRKLQQRKQKSEEKEQTRSRYSRKLRKDQRSGGRKGNRELQHGEWVWVDGDEHKGELWFLYQDDI